MSKKNRSEAMKKSWAARRARAEVPRANDAEAELRKIENQLFAMARSTKNVLARDALYDCLGMINDILLMEIEK